MGDDYIGYPPLSNIGIYSLKNVYFWEPQMYNFSPFSVQIS